MASRALAVSEQDLAASGIFTHASVGKASFHLTPDDVGDADVKVFDESGAVQLQAEATGEANTTGVWLRLTADQADALADHLSEAADDLRRRGQEGSDEN